MDLECSEEFVGEVCCYLRIPPYLPTFAYAEREGGRGKDETGMIVWDRSNMLRG